MRSMKVTVFVAVLFIVSGICVGQSTSLPYKQSAAFAVGGVGGWDCITFDASTNSLFIAHGSEITVVDAASGKVRGTVPANGAHGIAIIPDKSLGFSSNGRSGTVTIFDVKTLQPKQEIKVGENPDVVIYDEHTKTVIVMNGRSNDVTVIDPESLKVVATVPVQGKLEFAASDASHVYINVEDTGEIAVVNSKTWKAEQRWKLIGCEEPSGIAIDEKAGHLFSACGNKRMIVVDSKNGKIIATLDTGGGTDGAAIDPQLGYVLSPNGADATMTVVKAAPDGRYTVAAQVPTRRGARTIAVDPKSHRVFLPTAEFGPPAEGQKRPSIRPGTFTVLVFEPMKR